MRCFFVKKENVTYLAKQQKKGTEEIGRQIRYEFFNEILTETDSNKIATAHNSNDRAETVILNILRGSGISGLKGIEVMREQKYIRPLIDINRTDIEKYCKENGLNPRYDESNDENIYSRNKVRNIIIPYIKKEFNPNIIKTINRLSAVETEENDGVLLMTGARGTGKTHLGVSAVRALKGHYVNMEDLIYKVESSLNFKSPQTEEEIFKFYTEVDFLVIDEIGRSLKREKETEILSYILRKRYDNQLPVIVISNLDKEVLVKMLGGAVKDRLDEVAVSIEFKGDSYRILKRKAA